jgi:hypothetical protein
MLKHIVDFAVLIGADGARLLREKRFSGDPTGAKATRRLPDRPRKAKRLERRSTDKVNIAFLKGGRINLKPDEREEIFKHLEKMLETLHYGSITLVVQDGKIIQIEKNEKVRLQPNKNR